MTDPLDDDRPAQTKMTPTRIGIGCLKLAVLFIVVSFVGFLILMVIER